jgi:hypothetical protein
VSGWEPEVEAVVKLLADIREAVGDPEGRLMQDELVAHCRALREQATALLAALEPLVTVPAVVVSSADLARAREVYLRVKGGAL